MPHAEDYLTELQSSPLQKPLGKMVTFSAVVKLQCSNHVRSGGLYLGALAAGAHTCPCSWESPQPGRSAKLGSPGPKGLLQQGAVPRLHLAFRSCRRTSKISVSVFWLGRVVKD